jgi:hypothetical protein
VIAVVGNEEDVEMAVKDVDSRCYLQIAVYARAAIAACGNRWSWNWLDTGVALAYEIASTEKRKTDTTVTPIA